MPRRDGFPTNKEMVLEFNELSRTSYINKYNQVTEGGFPPMLEDKPLDALYFRAYKIIPEFMRTDDGVTAEDLRVEPLQEHQVNSMTSTLGFKDTPEEVVKHYRNVARLIGETTLHSDLDIVSILPPEAVNADYTAHYSTGRTRHISTFKEKPSKASIASGKFFAEQVIQLLEDRPISKPIDTSDFSEAFEHIRNIFERGGPISTGFSLSMRPNLPLNGHESREFLDAYANKMFEISRNAGDRLAIVESYGGVESLVESLRYAYEAANASYLRAQELLDKK